MGRFVGLVVSFVAVLGAASVGCSSAPSAAGTGESAAVGGRPGHAPTCASLGGQCKSSKIDVTFPSDCVEFGLQKAEGSCGDVVNQACCVPANEPAKNECEDQGGQCLGSKIDVTFPSDCVEYGLSKSNLSCGDLVTTACCVKKAPHHGQNDCTAAGGQCLGSKIDVTFPSDCVEYGLSKSDLSCGELVTTACCL
jgi:hypothetical protein